MSELEGEDQPWESLDVDDLDLSAFLRPCKRHFQCQLPSKANTTLSPTPSQSQFILKQKSKSVTDSQTQLASSSSSRLIPGPAGAVQAAMQRREMNGRDVLMLDEGKDPVPTQEFIRRVVENGDDNDHDFTSNPWLCALDFLRRKGMVSSDGKEIYVPLGSIRSPSDQRLEKVVAVVKSYKPNGLGDVMVTLKDPTGTIGATIHHKVFLNGEFCKGISVGAVLILQKVVVFSPTRSAFYLNVTPRNIINIISKDCGPPSKLSYPAVEVSRIEPNLQSCRNTSTPEQTTSPPRVGTEGILSSIRQSILRKENDQYERDRGSVNAPESSDNNGASRQANVPNDQDIGETNDLKNKMASKTALPEWTDEQLEELMAFD